MARRVCVDYFILIFNELPDKPLFWFYHVHLLSCASKANFWRSFTDKGNEEAEGSLKKRTNNSLADTIVPLLALGSDSEKENGRRLTERRKKSYETSFEQLSVLVYYWTRSIKQRSKTCCTIRGGRPKYSKNYDSQCYQAHEPFRNMEVS